MESLIHSPPSLDLSDDARPSTPSQREAHNRFRRVFDAQASRVHRTLRALGVPSASLDDAVQDVFLVVHDKLPSFVPNAQMSTWIYAITYRVAQNHRRRAQRSEHAPLTGEELSNRAGPESETAQSQAARFVSEFCAGLPEEKRDVFVLCVLEERTAPEVASLLCVKLNTIYSRLRNVRAEFRAQLLAIQREEVQ